MILQALADFYARQAAADSTAVAPPGFEKKEIPFVIVLDREGRLVDLEDTREGEGKKKRPRTFAVPQSVKRTVAVKANLLWDNPGYVVGLDAKGKVERAREQHEAFIETIDGLPEETRRDPGVAAVLEFLKRREFTSLFQHPLWQEVTESSANLSFRLAGDRNLVCQREAVVAALTRPDAITAEASDHCLVTGERDRIARLHPAIKGVWGAQTSGANIVSFNLDAFRSFGREQGANAPIGERAVFAYTTALNYLLGRDSRQRLQVGDASTVFWAERVSALEGLLADLFGEPAKDDPSRNADAVRSLFRAPETGARPFEGDTTRFYVLGLAPNAARIAVRFWYVGTVGEMADAIRRHFEDIEITHATFEPDVLSLFRLLVSTAALGKAENIRPNLAAAVIQSILTGAPYPRELLGAAVQRSRAEQQVTYARAALIKACLIREIRRSPDQPAAPEASVSLDPSNPSSAYRLGRLFAVLERAQEEANPGLNATIRDRFFGAASTTPVTVFPRLLKLNAHHISKLENRGRAVNLEKLIGGIVDGIDDFPPLLSLQDQGRFSIGYYHQRQDFFARRDSVEIDPVGVPA
jgi:CRISPR-associated protein Csd1